MVDKSRVLSSVIASLLVVCIIALFNLYGSNTTLKYQVQTLENKMASLETSKADREMQIEIRTQIRDINSKLDKLIAKKND